MKIPWTDEERDILRQMAGAGKRAREIGLVLKSRTEAAVVTQAQSLGLSLGGEKPEVDFEAFKRIMQNVRKTECL